MVSRDRINEYSGAYAMGRLPSDVETTYSMSPEANTPKTVDDAVSHGFLTKIERFADRFILGANSSNTDADSTIHQDSSYDAISEVSQTTDDVEHDDEIIANDAKHVIISSTQISTMTRSNTDSISETSQFNSSLPRNIGQEEVCRTPQSSVTFEVTRNKGDKFASCTNQASRNARSRIQRFKGFSQSRRRERVQKLVNSPLITRHSCSPKNSTQAAAQRQQSDVNIVKAGRRKLSYSKDDVNPDRCSHFNDDVDLYHKLSSNSHMDDQDEVIFTDLDDDREARDDEESDDGSEQLIEFEDEDTPAKEPSPLWGNSRIWEKGNFLDFDIYDEGHNDGLDWGRRCKPRGVNVKKPERPFDNDKTLRVQSVDRTNQQEAAVAVLKPEKHQALLGSQPHSLSPPPPPPPLPLTSKPIGSIIGKSKAKLRRLKFVKSSKNKLIRRPLSNGTSSKLPKIVEKSSSITNSTKESTLSTVEKPKDEPIIQAKVTEKLFGRHPENMPNITSFTSLDIVPIISNDRDVRADPYESIPVPHRSHRAKNRSLVYNIESNNGTKPLFHDRLRQVQGDESSSKLDNIEMRITSDMQSYHNTNNERSGYLSSLGFSGGDYVPLASEDDLNKAVFSMEESLISPTFVHNVQHDTFAYYQDNKAIQLPPNVNNVPLPDMSVLTKRNQGTKQRVSKRATIPSSKQDFSLLPSVLLSKPNSYKEQDQIYSDGCSETFSPKLRQDVILSRVDRIEGESESDSESESEIHTRNVEYSHDNRFAANTQNENLVHELSTNSAISKSEVGSSKGNVLTQADLQIMSRSSTIPCQNAAEISTHTFGENGEGFEVERRSPIGVTALLSDLQQFESQHCTTMASSATHDEESTLYDSEGNVVIRSELMTKVNLKSTPERVVRQRQSGQHKLDEVAIMNALRSLIKGTSQENMECAVKPSMTIQSSNSCQRKVAKKRRLFNFKLVRRLPMMFSVKPIPTESIGKSAAVNNNPSTYDISATASKSTGITTSSSSNSDGEGSKTDALKTMQVDSVMQGLVGDIKTARNTNNNDAAPSNILVASQTKKRRRRLRPFRFLYRMLKRSTHVFKIFSTSHHCERKSSSSEEASVVVTSVPSTSSSKDRAPSIAQSFSSSTHSPKNVIFVPASTKDERCINVTFKDECDEVFYRSKIGSPYSKTRSVGSDRLQLQIPPNLPREKSAIRKGKYSASASQSSQSDAVIASNLSGSSEKFARERSSESNKSEISSQAARLADVEKKLARRLAADLKILSAIEKRKRRLQQLEHSGDAEGEFLETTLLLRIFEEMITEKISAKARQDAMQASARIDRGAGTDSDIDILSRLFACSAS